MIMLANINPNQRGWILGLFLLLVGLSGCEERFLKEVEVDFEDNEVQLVLESRMRISDTLWVVFLTETYSILAEETSQAVSDADVNLFINGNPMGRFTETEIRFFSEDSLRSVYVMPWAAGQLQAGDVVRIEARSPSGKTAIAEELMPAAAQVANGAYREDRRTPNLDFFDHSIRFDLIDDGGQEDFYSFNFFKQDSFINQTQTFTNELGVGPGDEITVGLFLDEPILKDETFNGQTRTHILGTWYQPFEDPLLVDTKLILTVSTINKNSYAYYEALDAYYLADENPFAEPVVLPNGLIEGRGILSLVNDNTQLVLAIE